MQLVSQELLEAVRRDYHKIDRVRLVRQGVVVLDLMCTSGGVDADNSADIQRRFSAECAAPEPPPGQDDLIPYDLDDLTAPFGTEAWVQSGARIPVIAEHALVIEPGLGWNDGYRTGTSVRADGALVLGNT